MNREKLIKAVATKTGFMKEDISDMLAALEAAVIEGVSSREEVKLFKGFTVVGALEDEKTRRNPQTGEPVVVPAHTKVKVKVTKYFKDKVNP